MGLDWKIDVHDTLPSTQDVVKGMATSGEPEGRGVQSLVQTGGYGRRGRGWVSPSGNLYVSFLLRPACGVQEAAQLALVAGAAVYDAAVHFVGDDAGVQLKWPNDLLVGGRKCAGILLESDIRQSGAVDWVVLGIGVNIENAPPEIGIALKDMQDFEADSMAVRDVFLARFGSYYNAWKGGGFAFIRQSWLERAHPEGTKMKIKIGSREVRGYFHSLDVDGTLLLKDEDGQIRSVAAGEVYFDV